MDKLTTRQKFIVASALRSQVASMTRENEKYRGNFGDRITKDLAQECAARDEKIEAFDLVANELLPA